MASTDIQPRTVEKEKGKDGKEIKEKEKVMKEKEKVKVVALFVADHITRGIAPREEAKAKERI